MTDDDFVRRLNQAADALPTVTVPAATTVRRLARRRRTRQTLLTGGLGVAASGAMVLGAAALGPAATSSSPAGGGAVPSTAATEEAAALDDWLRQAREDDRVSDAQLATLELAAATGSMTLEQIDALLEDTAACMADAGVRFDRQVDEEVVPGFVLPRYTHGDPIELADACLFEHSHYAFGAYQTQPRHVEAQDDAVTRRLPEVLACLRERGADLPDDATLDDVRTADRLLLVESLHERAPDGQAPAPCSDPTGW